MWIGLFVFEKVLSNDNNIESRVNTNKTQDLHLLLRNQFVP